MQFKLNNTPKWVTSKNYPENTIVTAVISQTSRDNPLGLHTGHVSNGIFHTSKFENGRYFSYRVSESLIVKYIELEETDSSERFPTDTFAVKKSSLGLGGLNQSTLKKHSDKKTCRSPKQETSKEDPYSIGNLSEEEMGILIDLFFPNQNSPH